jgi:predicted outer membrane protein
MSRTPVLNQRAATRRHGLAAACAAALLGAAAQTGGSGTNVTPGGTTTNAPMARASAAGVSTLDRSDRGFMDKAAMGGMAEVHMGKMAQERGTSQQVKDFGARMVQDHGKANSELQQLASAKGLQLPADAGRSHMKDTEVKAFAAKTLPTLQEHLRLAQTTYDPVKNSK